MLWKGDHSLEKALTNISSKGCRATTSQKMGGGQQKTEKKKKKKI